MGVEDRTLCWSFQVKYSLTHEIVLHFMVCLCSGIAVLIRAYRDKDDSINYMGAGGA